VYDAIVPRTGEFYATVQYFTYVILSTSVKDVATGEILASNTRLETFEVNICMSMADWSCAYMYERALLRTRRGEHMHVNGRLVLCIL
jgi:hypothetical protein